MIDLFKDRYKVGLMMASLFLVGILASLYQIYRLPHALMLNGYHPAFSDVYIVVGITFVIGAFTVWSALHYKDEVIVFRDKQTDQNLADKENDAAHQSEITLDLVHESLKDKTGEHEIIQAGLQSVCKQLDAGQGAFYTLKNDGDNKKIVLTAGYALAVSETQVVAFQFGEGLIGQAAATGKTVYIDEVPEGYVKIISGLGSASPRSLLIVSVKHKEKVLGIIEIASFTELTESQRKFAEASAQLIAEKISGSK